MTKSQFEFRLTLPTKRCCCYLGAPTRKRKTRGDFLTVLDVLSPRQDDSPEEEATLPLQNYRQPEQSIVNLFTSQRVIKEESSRSCRPISTSFYVEGFFFPFVADFTFEADRS